MITASCSLSDSTQAADDSDDPLTSSATTLPSDDDEPSAMRTTLTSEPRLLSDAAKAELKLASPQAVGGKVLRIPNRTVRARGRCAAGESMERKVGTTFKTIPMDDGTGAAA